MLNRMEYNSNKVYGFFGDSNIYLFKGVKSQLNNVVLGKFAGIPIKSLLNKTEHYNKLLKLIKTNKVTHGFFMFGLVDINFYYYYKKYVGGDPDIYSKIKSYAEEYVREIKNLI